MSAFQAFNLLIFDIYIGSCLNEMPSPMDLDTLISALIRAATSEVKRELNGNRNFLHKTNKLNSNAEPQDTVIDIIRNARSLHKTGNNDINVANQPTTLTKATIRKSKYIGPSQCIERITTKANRESKNSQPLNRNQRQSKQAVSSARSLIFSKQASINISGYSCRHQENEAKSVHKLTISQQPSIDCINYTDYYTSHNARLAPFSGSSTVSYLPSAHPSSQTSSFDCMLQYSDLRSNPWNRSMTATDCENDDDIESLSSCRTYTISRNVSVKSSSNDNESHISTFSEGEIL
ncbi:hypothetical protein GJ496_009301 [Pomphorhynchus laevis]|nr:hypothetical protein GJ496_009301 [Pomphorhynchus laevis]